MHVTIVSIQVKPGHVAEFIEACRLNHLGSVAEPGNRRFDVLQSADDPTQFVLYEAYDSAEHAAAHKATAHYARWQEAVAPWLAAPRTRAGYRALYPA